MNKILVRLYGYLLKDINIPLYQLIFIILIVSISLTTFDHILDFFHSKTRHSQNQYREYYTNFATLETTYYENDINEKYWDVTGPFEILGNDEYLFIAQCGAVYISHIIDDNFKLGSKKIGELNNVICHEDFNYGVVKDSLLLEKYLLVSYLARSDGGYHLVLDKIPRDNNLFNFNHSERIFESQTRLKPPYLRYNQTSGRIASKNENEIFFIVGSSGATKSVIDGSSSLGKIFLINLTNSSQSMFAIGFRSPGGLYYDQVNSSLWESEHGPRGGDEINLVKPGLDYGWPAVSYGTYYKKNIQSNFYKLDIGWGQHNGYTKPEYVFLPSVGVSNIIQYPADGSIKLWRGDLILASLKNETLYRLKLENNSIIYAEPLGKFGRIRDSKIDAKGIIYLKTDNREFIRIEALDK